MSNEHSAIKEEPMDRIEKELRQLEHLSDSLGKYRQGAISIAAFSSMLLPLAILATPIAAALFMGSSAAGTILISKAKNAFENKVEKLTHEVELLRAAGELNEQSQAAILARIDKMRPKAKS